MIQRVLMTVDAVGGVWTYALDLARALGARNVEVSLAVMGPAPFEDQRADAAALPCLELHERPFRLEWMDNPWEDVADAGAWLLDLEQRVAPDVVHVNGYCHASLPWQAPALVVAHSCVLSWWRAVHGTDAPPEWNRYAREVTRGLRAAACVVAPTAAMLAMIQRHYGPLARTCVIANGRYPPASGAPKERFVFTAGRLWDPAKNVQALCAAAPHIPWPVYVAGDAGSASPPASPHVRVLGRLSARETAAWMARAAIYALPARYEPFGLTAVEAALAGCALVVGDIPSLREVWDDAALYVTPDDPHTLVAALTTLVGDEGLRHRLARRAAERARALTPERMASGYRETYDALLVERATGAARRAPDAGRPGPSAC